MGLTTLTPTRRFEFTILKMFDPLNPRDLTVLPHKKTAYINLQPLWNGII